jgi:hypothetical protein
MNICRSWDPSSGIAKLKQLNSSRSNSQEPLITLQVVPEGLFPNLTRIVKLEFNHNSIHALPSDIRALQ